MARYHAVPYVGRQAYHLSQCVKMALDYRGDSYALDYLESVSTQPFGFVYRRTVGGGGFAAVACDPALALRRTLQLLGYPYTCHTFPSPVAALDGLRAALDAGPAIAGPLNAASLPYAPRADAGTGTGRTVVVVGLDRDVALVNDPEGYPGVAVPLTDFLRAWRADHLTGAAPYTLWQVGPRATVPDPLAVALGTLELAATNLQRDLPTLDLGASALLRGPEALRALAEDVRAGGCGDWLGRYPAVSWPVSAQRCADRADFLVHAPCTNDRLRHAAAISRRQALLFGRAQLANVQGDTDALAAVLLDLAAEEEQFTLALLDGLQLAQQRYGALAARGRSCPLLPARAG